ncbi:MAG TPA: hypothetical protein VGM03_14865 [Phycisphaerae bacterium]
MAAILNKVVKILKNELTRFEHHLEYVRETGRVTGFIISSTFSGMDDDKRQKRLWEGILRKQLTADELRKIGPIVAMSPEEAAIHAVDR